MKKTILFVFILGCITGMTFAYNQYSTDQTDNCADCHGDFREGPYVSTSDGGTWSSDLHEAHQTMVDGDCNACHSPGPRFPVLLGSSWIGPNGQMHSCAGCHGRAADGTGSGTEGFAAGLRQHHFVTGAATCDGAGCHADSDPANKVTVGEDILPSYYGDTTNYPFIPTDPCNLPPDYNEDYESSTLGLDNDGDGNYDDADTDCGAAAGTPGQASDPAVELLLVTAHDVVLSNMSLSYGPACEATDNTIEFGPLSDVGTYGYTGQVCSIGNTGAYDWNYAGTPLSMFFVVAANNGAVEGSYGLDSAGAERPEDTTSADCPVPQSLADRCD